MKKAVNNVRSGNGPHFLEFSTYRWREHCGHNFDNDIGYRSQDEFLEWQAKDPLKLLESRLTKDGSNTTTKLSSIKEQIDLEVAAAFEFAEASSFPDQLEAYEGVYATEETSK